MDLIPLEVTSGYSTVCFAFKKMAVLERKLNIAFNVLVDSEIF